ncbi:MAG: flavodoxin [Bacteroidales bacterium]
MKKIAIVYWPKRGNVSNAAKKIHRLIEDKADLYKLTDVGKKQIEAYDYFIFGSSTVGADAWQDANTADKWLPFFKKLEDKNIRMAGKTVALFGLGDQVLYPDHFVDGMSILKKEFERLQADVVGYWPNEGYSFTDSASLEGDYFVGLAFDEDHQENLTEPRAAKWLQMLEKYGF